MQYGAKLILQKIQAGTLQQIKLAVPSPAAGVILGKGGENVAQMMELTGSCVTLSSTDAIRGSSERLATLSGTFEQNFGALRLILHKMQEADIYGTYQNNSTSYLQFSNSG